MNAVQTQSIPFVPYYDCDGITIYNADCKQVLPFMPKFDLLLTDPPYGIGESRRKQKTRSTFRNNRYIPAKDYGENDWDQESLSSVEFEDIRSIAKWQIIFGGNFLDMVPASSCWLVWDKDNSGDFADCELAWTNLKMAVRKFKWRWNGMLQEKMGDKKEIRVHPTQKPVPLMRWCLSWVPDAATVIDPFMGSGTTLVAAKLENRNAIGIEINESYCESAAKRLSQGVLF